MDDLDETMDYFLDVFQLVYNPRMGLRNEMPDLLDNLEVIPYAAQHIGPEVTRGLHELVKKACIEIRSVKRLDMKSDDMDESIEEQDQILYSLDKILIRHASIFQEYIRPHVAQAILKQDEIEVIQLEIEPTDKSSDDDYTSIDG